MINPPENNEMVGGCNKHPGQSFLNCYYCMLDSNKSVGSEKPKKKRKKIRKSSEGLFESIKKKPTMKGFCVKNDIINSTLDWIDNINKGVEMGLYLSSDEYAMLDDISNRALKLIKTRRK